MTKRQVMALIALLGVLVAAYLALYKTGVIGTLTCAVGACDTVQMSRWATLFGLPVAVWGVGYYVLVLAVVLAGLQERLEDSRALTLGILVLTGWGFVFSVWLTYLELFVIHAVCMWCVISAILATALFALAWLDWRERRTADDEVPPPA
jgi:uncharacterized membrane protein